MRHPHPGVQRSQSALKKNTPRSRSIPSLGAGIMSYRVYPGLPRYRIIVPLLVLVAVDAVPSSRASNSSDRSLPNTNSSFNRSHNMSDTALTMRVKTDLVQIPVTVADRSGKVFERLIKENFTVFENGVEQTIRHFAFDEAPISLCIVFDTSLSMAGKLHKSIQAVNELLDKAKFDDEYCLVRFSDSPEIIVPLSSSSMQVAAAMPQIHPWGFTALFDGVDLGIEEVRRGHNRHKAIVIISDGGDNRSVHTQDQIRQLVRESEVQVCAIGILVPESEMFSQAEVDGPGLLKRLSRESGGHLFLVHDITELPTAIAKITGALRYQYVLGYYPKDANNDGKYRHVTVRLRPPKGAPRLRISWRTGYYAPKQ